MRDAGVVATIQSWMQHFLPHTLELTVCNLSKSLNKVNSFYISFCLWSFSNKIMFRKPDIVQVLVTCATLCQWWNSSKVQLWVGRFFGLGTTIQENGSSLLCDVISGFHETSINREIGKSIHFFLPLTHSRLWSLKSVFCAKLCNFQRHFCCCIQKQETNQAFCKKRKLSLSVCACFVREWNTESQSRLDPFSCVIFHWPKNCPTSLFWKGTTSEEKIQGHKLFRYSKQDSCERLFLQKNYLG